MKRLCLNSLFILLLATACSLQKEYELYDPNVNIAVGDLRKVAFAIVSSAENSTLDYTQQYGYIEDIGDGRGYTAGLIGFTSATNDLLDVVELYCRLQPYDNPLASYLPALRAVNGTASHEGLDAPFVAAWKKASTDPLMQQAQNHIIDSLYMLPAIAFAQEDGLSPLGQFVYYDAMVMHGPGDDEDNFNGIRMAALQKQNPPSEKGNERTYLLAFVKARSRIMKKEEAHADLSRIDAQKKWIKQGRYALSLPLQWSMYGDSFTLTQDFINSLP
ncbi:MAG: chitosanase [Paludibacter sp.]|nr:chitosanase [Bacteroidales bacterium]MCM1068911.1 chitosanase [Prevotella sp.]MCM1353172.1 chitosanase [Bacteroides sp.]MCM1442494.1 chitosanase [Muribaculum sp.]MCM1481337.1 chitosanase [Paludibacter sp.]